MGRLIRMRSRRSSLYVVEETIASLHEELQFTLNYAHAMVRDRNYSAAAEVIEEQRRSLARATKRVERAIAPEAPVRRQARVRATLVGVAAAMALATGAFAAFGPASNPKPATGTRVQAFQEASEALSFATTSSDPVAVQAIVGDAQEKILAVAGLNPSDPALQLSLLESVAKLQKVAQNTKLPASVRAQAKKVAEQVQEIVVDTADETRETDSKTTSKTTTKTETSAPAAEPSV